MKSLFSCFPRRVKKSKSREKNASNNGMLEKKEKAEIVPKCEVTPNHIDNNSENNEDFQNKGDISKIADDLEIIKQLEIKKTAENEALYNRYEDAMRRINNIYLVLNGKRNMYDISVVIQSLNNILEKLNESMIQLNDVDSTLIEKLNIFKELLTIQLDILENVKNKTYKNFDTLFEEWRLVVKKGNMYCDKEDFMFEIHRIIADSLLIFGWMDCTERPKEFANGTADGCAVCVNNLVANERYSEFVPFLKLWVSLIKQIATVVSQNFEIAFIWGIDGPRPINILRDLMELNYANFQTERVIGKQKTLKTKRPEEVTYDEMTNLMSDLRSGLQKDRLKKTSNSDVKRDKPRSSGKHQLMNLRDKEDKEIKPSKSGKDVVEIIDCINCSIHISGAISSLFVEKCANLKLLLEDVSQQLNFKKCNDVEAQAIGELSLTEVEDCKEFRLFLPFIVTSNNFLLKTKDCPENINVFLSKTEDGGLEPEDFDKTEVSNNSSNRIVDSRLVSEILPH